MNWREEVACGKFLKEPKLEVVSWWQFVGISSPTFYLLGILTTHVALKLNVTFTAFHIVLYLRFDLVTR